MKRTDADMNLRFAWAVIVLGYNQHDVAALFSVNGGRVAEAVRAVRMAIADPVRFTEAATDAEGEHPNVKAMDDYIKLMVTQ